MSWVSRSRSQELVDEVHLSLSRHLRGVACAHFTIYAENVLLHGEQALLDVTLIGLVETLTVVTKIVVVA